MATPKTDIYGGRDPRDVPAYSIVEAAGFLRLPPTTLRHWVRGQVYRTRAGRRRARPVICIPAGQPPTLTFWNLAEAHVLAAIRREHGVSLQSARKALDYVARELGHDRPLIGLDFLTDGINLFVERLETMAADDPGVRSLINASLNGQLAARQLLEGALARVSRDTHGLIERIYPWVKKLDEPRRIEIESEASLRPTGRRRYPRPRRRGRGALCRRRCRRGHRPRVPYGPGRGRGRVAVGDGQDPGCRGRVSRRSFSSITASGPRRSRSACDGRA